MKKTIVCLFVFTIISLVDCKNTQSLYTFSVSGDWETYKIGDCFLTSYYGAKIDENPSPTGTTLKIDKHSGHVEFDNEVFKLDRTIYVKYPNETRLVGWLEYGLEYNQCAELGKGLMFHQYNRYPESGGEWLFDLLETDDGRWYFYTGEKWRETGFYEMQRIR